LVRPYSIGTFTQSETPSLLGAPKIVHCGQPQAREFSDDGPFDEGLRRVPKGFTGGSSIVAKGGSKAAKGIKKKKVISSQKP
jgi:hypothetical protein